MPNLYRSSYPWSIRSSKYIHILTGSGHEAPEAARDFAGILYNKGITYELDDWGPHWKTSTGGILEGQRCRITWIPGVHLR